MSADRQARWSNTDGRSVKARTSKAFAILGRCLAISLATSILHCRLGWIVRLVTECHAEPLTRGPSGSSAELPAGTPIAPPTTRPRTEAPDFEIHFSTSAWDIHGDFAFSPDAARAVGDFDGDGAADLAISRPGSGEADILLSNTLAGFRVVKPPARFAWSDSVLLAAGDTDGDRCADLLLWRLEGGKLARMRGDCHGGFIAMHDGTDGDGINVPGVETLGLFALAPSVRNSALRPILRDIRGGPLNVLRRWNPLEVGILQAPTRLLESAGTGRALVGSFEGLLEPGVVVPDAEQLRWHLSETDGTNSYFASFPTDFRPDLFVPGDYNGDGKTDIYAHSSSRFGSWIAYSQGPYAIELPVQSPFDRALPAVWIGSGDFDGDGYDDLVAAVDSPLSWWVARVNAQRSVASDRNETGRAASFGESSTGPYVCIGYVPNPPPFVDTLADPRRVKRDKWSMQVTGCPKGYAFYNITNGSPAAEERLRHDYTGSCCRLPFADMLTSEHVDVDTRCPDGSVVTGATPSQPLSGTPSKLRCTKVNSERYTLSAARPGRYWGFGLGMRSERDEISKAEIPLAIRYGIGRENYTQWDSHGCIGDPAGALLSEANGKRCVDHQFREVLYRGIGGDPVAGTPVEMFPHCASLGNQFRATSGCSVAKPAVPRSE